MTVEVLGCEVCGKEKDSHDFWWDQICPKCKESITSGGILTRKEGKDWCAWCGRTNPPSGLHIVSYGQCGKEIECVDEEACEAAKKKLGKPFGCNFCGEVYYGKDDGGTWLQICNECVKGVIK